MKFYNNVAKFFSSDRIKGFIICDSTGLPIDSDLDINLTEEVAVYVTSLIEKGEQVINALKEGSLKSIRLETAKGKVIVKLENNKILIIFIGPETKKIEW